MTRPPLPPLPRRNRSADFLPLAARPDPRRAGLSLFEMLMALALLAAISTALAGSLGLSIRTHERSLTLGEATAPVVARLHLRRYLTLAQPPSQLSALTNGFEGRRTGVRFTTLAETGLAPAAAGLRVSVTAQDGQIVMLLEPLRDEGTVQDPMKLVLADEAEAVEMSYFNPAATPPGWQDSWPESASTLPAAIRITARPGSTPDWPDFLVRPGLATGTRAQ